MVEICKVGASSFGPILGFITFQEFSLDHLRIVNVNTVFDEAFKPSDCLVHEAHFELKKLVGVIPSSNGTGIVDAHDEKASCKYVPACLSVKKQNVRRSFCTVVVVQDLLDVLSDRDVDDVAGGGRGGSRVGSWVNRLGHDEALVAMLRV